MSTVPLPPSLVHVTALVPVPAPGLPTDPQEQLPWDIVEEWGLGSFPASDPPANW